MTLIEIIALYKEGIITKVEARKWVLLFANESWALALDDVESTAHD